MDEIQTKNMWRAAPSNEASSQLVRKRNDILRTYPQDNRNVPCPGSRVDSRSGCVGRPPLLRLRIQALSDGPDVPHQLDLWAC